MGTNNNKHPVFTQKWYLKYLTQKLKNFELGRLNDYDYLIAVSERDLKEFKNLGYKNGAMASPIGLNLGHYANIKPIKTLNSMCFIGALTGCQILKDLIGFCNRCGQN